MIPKIRAWDTHEEVMNRVDYVDFVNGVIGMSNENVRDYEQPIHRVNIMQYTGCRDKNGIEIYEGDVIKDKYDKTWLVQWYVGAFVITDKIPDSDGQTSTYSHFSNVSNHHFYFEVIGNIYENPELLEDIKPYFDELEEQE